MMLSTTRRLATVARPGRLSLLNAPRPSRTPILELRRALRIPRQRLTKSKRAEPGRPSEQDPIAHSLLHNGKPPEGQTRSSKAQRKTRPSHAELGLLSEQDPIEYSLLQTGTPPKGDTRSSAARTRPRGNKPEVSIKNRKIDLTTAATVQEIGETPWPRPEELPWWGIDRYSIHHVVRHVHSALSNTNNVAVDISEERIAMPPPYESITNTKCILRAKFDDETIILKVIGRNSKRAKVLAYMHLVAVLRAKGVDETLYTPPLVSRSKTRLIDVFEHCASLSLVPKVQLQQGKKGCTVEITMDAPLDRSKKGKGFTVSSGPPSGPLSAFRKACENFWEVAKQDPAHMEMKEGQVKTFNWIDRLSGPEFSEWLRRHQKLKWAGKYPKHGRVNSGVLKYTLLGDSTRYMERVYDLAETRVLLEIAVAVVVSQKRPDWVAEFLAKPAPGTVLASKAKSVHEAETMAVLQKGPNQSIRMAAPTNLDIWHGSLDLMQRVPDLDLSAIQRSEEARGLRNRQRKWSSLTEAQKQEHSQRLLAAFQRYERDVERSILNARRGLPVTAYKSELIDLVDNNVYSIFIGATGSGKTTQVPRLIFEDWCRRGLGADCNIICTQPRVIAATSVASRVGDEMGSTLKERVGSHVRHNVDVPTPRDGSITFCTTGILLQQIQHEPDYIFDNVSHLILDEVHERDMTLDFTLAVLKRAIADRLACGKKVPRVLLMSATLDEEAFKRHFQNVGRDGKLTDAPSLSVPGRTFPVKELYLEDVLRNMHHTHKSMLDRFRKAEIYGPSAKHIELELNLDAAATGSSNTMSEAGVEAETGISTSTTGLQEVKDDETDSDLNWDGLKEEATPIALIAETIAHVLHTTKEGAVLVFLPGLGEIRKVEDALREYRPLGIDISDARKYSLFQLHSSLPDSQRTVFQTCPRGVRKIILSSPIAETSVTIPDVTVVIDSGQVRETQYDNASRASWLRNSWIHGSSAKQRAGRAGRVQAGDYLAMYSKARRERMPFAGIPELRRSDLQSTCLTVKSKFTDVDVPEFLASALDPPSEANIAEAMKSLVDTGALTPAHELTSLGHLLSRLSIHPSLGKMIIMGIVFKCLDPIVVAGAAFEQNDLWSMKMDHARLVLNSKKYFADGSFSDPIATYQAYCHLKKMDQNDPSARERAMQEGFQWTTYKRIKESIKAIKENLQESGILPRRPGLPRKHNGSDDERVGGEALNVNSHMQHVIKAVLVAGLQSNIGGRDSRKDKKRYNLGDRPDATFHMGSLFSRVDTRPSDLKLVTFGQLAASKDGYVMQNVTYTPALTAALFSCTITDASKRLNGLALLANNFLPLPIRVVSQLEGPQSPASAASAVLRFRTTLDRVLDVAFENLARAQRGAMVSRADEAAVEDFVARVVEVLTQEVVYDDVKKRLIEAAPKQTEVGRSRRRRKKPRVRMELQQTSKGPMRLPVPTEPRSPDGEAQKPYTNPAKDLMNTVLRANGGRGRATSKGTSTIKKTGVLPHSPIGRHPRPPPGRPAAPAAKVPRKQSLW